MQPRDLALSASPSPATHPDHHVWRNGRRWWIAFTFHTADGRKQRVRESLGTLDLAEARARRDELLARFERESGHTLSLRFCALSSFDLGLDASA